LILCRSIEFRHIGESFMKGIRISIFGYGLLLGLLLAQPSSLPGKPSTLSGGHQGLTRQATQRRESSPRQPSAKRLHTPGVQPIHSLAQLQREIRRIITHRRFATTRWGILIESLDRRKVFFSHEADQLFTPASNMKLYTTAAALVHLGPDYRFRTSVYTTAKPDPQGVIDGDLILYGRGDPNLSTRASDSGPLTSLDRLADQLSQAGVREIRGHLIGDESYFSGPPLGVGWEWDDLQWYYGAEISALSTNDNAIELMILPGASPGDPAEVFTLPETSHVTILNKVVTAAVDTPPQVGIHRGLGDNMIEVWGSIPTDGEGFRAFVAVHQPALYAATLLGDALAQRGIRVTGEIRRADAAYRRESPVDFSKLTELAFVESIPLSEEVRILNKISQNLHTELLLRTLGAVVEGEGSASKGVDVVMTFLRATAARTQGVSLQDGSGLSRHNLIAPATTVDLLRYMYQHRQRDIFIASLPVAGVDGTLERRMVGTPAEGKVQAKTGSLRYASTLSGYVTTARGEHLVFSIMANNHTGDFREVVTAANEICVLLARFDVR
jgi:D-alanyl-D-alanine carboxypeptidase/D-alanyl-D-alanine-endopeptidase (penicillin-binding protein 4)